MAGKCVAGQQRRIQRQHQRADRDPEMSLRPESAPDVVPEKNEHDERNVQQVAMQILQQQRERRFTGILAALSFGDRAAGRM